MLSAAVRGSFIGFAYICPELVMRDKDLQPLGEAVSRVGFLKKWGCYTTLATSEPLNPPPFSAN
jgi:hypothetical protein